jgi:hypothetical protein
MFEWTACESFVVDVTELRRLDPGVLTLSAWAHVSQPEGKT